jgi:hypothetical protein
LRKRLAEQASQSIRSHIPKDVDDLRAPEDDGGPVDQMHEAEPEDQELPGESNR